MLNVGDVRSTSIVVVPANAADQKTDDRPFALGRIALSAPTAGSAVYAVQPPSVTATSMDNRTVITIAGLSDSLGRLVPDGTKFAMTAQNFGRTDGYCCTNSAGGTLLGGVATPNDGRMRTYETVGGQIAVTYSAEGLVYGPGTIATAVVVVVPADAANNKIGDRPILAIPVKLAAVSSGTIVPEVSSVLGDGAVHPVRVTLSGLKDALGNPVPTVRAWRSRRPTSPGSTATAARGPWVASSSTAPRCPTMGVCGPTRSPAVAWRRPTRRRGSSCPSATCARPCSSR